MINQTIQLLILIFVGIPFGIVLWGILGDICGDRRKLNPPLWVVILLGILFILAIAGL